MLKEREFHFNQEMAAENQALDDGTASGMRRRVKGLLEEVRDAKDQVDGYDKEFLDSVVEEVKNGRDDLYKQNRDEVLRMYDEAKEL